MRRNAEQERQQPPRVEDVARDRAEVRKEDALDARLRQRGFERTALGEEHHRLEFRAIEIAHESQQAPAGSIDICAVVDQQEIDQVAARLPCLSGRSPTKTIGYHQPNDAMHQPRPANRQYF